MEIGGLVLEAYTIFLGNPDVMASIIGWSVFLTISFVVIHIFRNA